MKEEVLNIGFTETGSPLWLQYRSKHFYISLCLGGYFFIYTNKAREGQSAPFDYKGPEKLKSLINAHEEYFK